MIAWQYEQLRAEKGLLNLAGCAEGDGGCRKLFLPVAVENAGLGAQQEEEEKQDLLRAHLFARSIAIGRSYAAFHTGGIDTYVERLCLGPGDNGTYYLTISADASTSGDGRLSSSIGADGYYATVDPGGIMQARKLPGLCFVPSTRVHRCRPTCPLTVVSLDFVLQAVDGVETTGWRARTGDFTGCWCCDHGSCADCGPTASPAACQNTPMPSAALRKVLGYSMFVEHLEYSAGLVRPACWPTFHSPRPTSTVSQHT